MLQGKLSDRISRAIADHAQEFPNGDWVSVNERLGRLWHECAPILQANGRSPHLGNEETVKFLKQLGM